MATTDKRIVRILPDSTGAGIRKVGGWIGYAYRIEYELEDGTVIKWTTHSRLLRDAKSEIASLPKEPKHPMTANYHDGQVGTVSTLYGRVL